MNKFIDFFFPKTEGDKRASRVFGIAAIVLVIVVLINVFAGVFKTNITQFDISGNGIYKISDESKTVVSALENDVDLIMVYSGEPDNRITKFIYGYAALSSRLHFGIVDPNDDPSILTKYNCSANQLVVSCEATGKTAVIDVIGTSNALMTVTMNSYTGSAVPAALDADGQLTSAVMQVTGEASETAYILTGHGESDFPSNAVSFIAKNNINLAENSVNLLKDEGGIPDDCSALICFNPISDLADDELKILRNYLQSGGNFMLLINDSSLENFNALIKEYGLEIQSGVVGDVNNFYYNYINYYGYFCLYPELSQASSVTANISSDALILYPFGMLETEPARDTITVDPFMTTSDGGLMYISDEDIVSDTTFIIGARAMEETDSGARSCFTVFTTANLIDDAITTTYPSMSNIDIFINALTSNMSSITAVSIPATPLTTSLNTVNGARPISIILMYILPLLIIVYGIIYCVRRKKR